MKLTKPQAYLLQKIADGDAVRDCLAADLPAPSRVLWERVLRTLHEKGLVLRSNGELTTEGEVALRRGTVQARVKP